MIKVYDFCKCDLVVTNLCKEETHKWYEKYTDEDVDINSVTEEDLNTKLNIETINGSWDIISIGEYIKDISSKDMPIIIASKEL